MKKLLVALAAVLVTAATYGQGTVDFNNYTQNNGAGAPIYDVGQSGPNGRGPGAGVTAGLLVNGNLIGTTDFSNLAGFETLLNPITLAAAGVPGGSTVTFEVRAWSTAAGTGLAGYDAARVNPLYKFGTSGTFAGVLGGAGDPAGPPSNLDNLTSFSLQVVPEPSTIALGVIGGLALLLRRRK